MTLIAIAGIPPQAASTLHMVGVLIIAVGVEYNRTGLLVFIIPFALGVIIPVSSNSVWNKEEWPDWNKSVTVPIYKEGNTT